MNHVVNKQLFDLRMRSSANAHAIQSRLASIAELLQDKLDKVLSSSFPGDAYIRLDKLEIDLGKINVSHLEEEFIAVFYDKVKEEIDRQSGQLYPAHPRKVMMADLLKSFFISGTLPWWAEKNLQESIDQLVSSLIKNAPESFLNLLYSIAETPASFKRMELNLSLSTLVSAIKLIIGSQEEYVRQQLKDVMQAEWSFIHDKQKAIHLIEVLIQSSNFNNSKKIDLAIVKKLLQQQTSLNTLDKNIPSSVEPTKEKTARKKPNDPYDMQDRYLLVQNAGLVIAAPYFTSLFTHLGYIDPETGKIKTKDIKVIAMHLIQYLVNGEEEHPEYQLVLNKLLCGLEINEPVPSSAHLQEEEKQEVIRMLEHLMKYWTVMENASVEGFRNSFFKREGLLRQTGDGWSLKVEKKSFDIVMDSMPWSIQMISLPCMNEIIYVEW